MIGKHILVWILATACAVSAFGQSWYIGPDVGYTVSTSVPSEVSNSGAPVRYRIGALVFMPASTKLDVRFLIGYRGESGSFATPYSTPNITHNWLDVVEPDPNAPKVRSELTSSSVDLGAELFFPLGDLDTSGSKIGFSVGAYADRLLSATQTDDYSGIPNYDGENTVSVAYDKQFGFGAMLGVGMYIPMGSGRLAFDVKYVVRQPATMTAQTTPPTEQNSGWLMGPGIRMSLAYVFRL